jgi:hypothetical protein
VFERKNVHFLNVSSIISEGSKWSKITD